MQTNTAAFFEAICGSQLPTITFISSPNRDVRGSIIPSVHDRVKPKPMYLKRFLRQAAVGSTELFFAPVPMRGDGMPSEAIAQDAGVIWSDVDHEFTEEQWALIERLDATVNESGGVGRHHVFVPLDEPHPPHVIKELNQALRVALDGDSKQSPASFLRVPGSWNRKGEPVLCRTVRLSSSRQTLPSVRQALRMDGESVSAQSRVSGERETPTGALSASALPEIPEGFNWLDNKPGYARMRKVKREWDQRFDAPGSSIRRYTAAGAIVKEAIRRSLTIHEAYGFAMECKPLLDKAEEENGYSIQKDIARIWRREMASTAPALAKSAGVRDEPGVTSADDDEPVRRKTKLRQPKSRFLTRQELRERPEPKWLIERLLPEYGVGQLFGPTYGGKTYAAIDLVMRITTGMGHWIGHTIKLSGPVFYVLMEGGFDFGKRLDAWELKYGRTSDELYVMVEEELNLADAESLERLAEDITAVSSTPRLLVIDTQSLAIQGVDENDNTGMNEVMQNLKRLSKALGCFVLMVHHTGHANEDRARGASAQPAALDTIIRITGSDRNGRKIAVPKVKAGREIKDQDFRLEEQKNGWPAFVELSVGEILEREMTDEDRIVRYLRHNGPAGWKAVAEALSMAESTCRRKCGEMTDPNKVEGGKPRLRVAGMGGAGGRMVLYAVVGEPDLADI